MTLRYSIILLTLAVGAPTSASAQGFDAFDDVVGDETRPKADTTVESSSVPGFGMYRPYLLGEQQPIEFGRGPATNRLRDFGQMAVASPEPYVLAVGGSVIDQIGDFPGEWSGSDGFGKRTLARMATGFASDAIGHGMAAVLNHRVRYERCICSGIWNRTTHALAWGFVTRHDNGEMVMHSSVFVAKFAAAGLANAWYPSSYSGNDVAREGAVGIGINALLNVAREFTPELGRLVGIR
jgi:hypothetical protein